MKNKHLHITLLGIAIAMILSACASLTSTPDTVTIKPTTAMPGGRLIFSRFIEATHTFTGMFVSRSNGSDEIAVPLPGPEGGGRWSRSGTLIAVMTVLSDQRIGTAIISTDGTVLRVFEIPDATLNVSCTIWSSDDARLACEAWDDADPSRDGIYTVRASDGGDLQRLTNPPDGMKDLPGDFSPTGQLIFKRHIGDEGNGPLMLVDANGGEPQLFYSGMVEDPGRFTADGQLVVTSMNGNLLVIKLDSTIVHEISVDGKYLFGPTWSPDGTRIAFSMTTTGDAFSDVYTSMPDGTDRQQVTQTTDNEIGVDWGR
jgi:TolB protein